MNNATLMPNSEESTQPSKLNVTIIYETAPDGIRAKRLSDKLASEVSAELEFSVNLNVWNFQVLMFPEIREIAADTVASADMIILSVSGAESLPPHLANWMDRWSCLNEFKNPPVFTLYADSIRANAPIRSDLVSLADRKGLNFI